MDILDAAERNAQKALEVLEKTGVLSAWESIGATVNIVGSLRSRLIMKNMDIDLHIYTTDLSVAESFSVIGRLAADLPFSEVSYRNLIDTEEECMEWHAVYKNEDGVEWKFDMIHIRKGSKYDGRIEAVTDAIAKRLTPVQRRSVLEIKNGVPSGETVPGIEIYHAVLEGNVRTYEEYRKWRTENPVTVGLDWMP